MSAANTPTKKINFFSHFPHYFIRPYGTQPTTGTLYQFADKLSAKNCEYMLRPHVGLSEAAQGINQNYETITDNATTTIFTDQTHAILDTIMNELKTPLTALNNRDNTTTATANDVYAVMKFAVDGSADIDKWLEGAIQTSSSLYVMAVHLRALKALGCNSALYASKMQSEDPSAIAFKTHKGVDSMQRMFESMCCRGAPGNGVGAMPVNLVGQLQRPGHQAAPLQMPQPGIIAPVAALPVPPVALLPPAPLGMPQPAPIVPVAPLADRYVGLFHQPAAAAPSAASPPFAVASGSGICATSAPAPITSNDMMRMFLDMQRQMNEIVSQTRPTPTPTTPTQNQDEDDHILTTPTRKRTKRRIVEDMGEEGEEDQQDQGMDPLQSLPVLSWLFIACRIDLAATAGPLHQQSLPGPTSSQPEGRASASPGRVHGLRVSARQTQPLEPILFPKLRIYFADFPYLHCSINQRLLTSETCCGYEYDRTRESPSPPDFQGPSGAHRTPQEVWCFTGHRTLAPGKLISG
ncbi:hypothetical protein QZH41_012374 [Actinostola sp. cb2023]|nr:hypothetical protein QZH41_012374 [Actinostola sp. cb2023]